MFLGCSYQWFPQVVGGSQQFSVILMDVGQFFQNHRMQYVASSYYSIKISCRFQAAHLKSLEKVAKLGCGQVTT